MGDYDQFAGERLNGRASASAKSKVKCNVNVANQGLLDEQEHHLPYVLRIITRRDVGLNDDSDDDDDDIDDEIADGSRGKPGFRNYC